MERHPYLGAYLEIIRRSPMTVNYNFDDYIERMLEETRPSGGTDDMRTRTYETVWDPRLQSRLTEGVIYHPNGFLPENKLERASPGLIFCEDEFADQLIESVAGRYASLLHYFSKHTCLLIGLSLNDSTLRHLLRQNALLNPGHFHYYVAFQEQGQTTPDDQRQAVFNANFEGQNLITLFLNAERLRALGHLIAMPSDGFDKLAGPPGVSTTYCFYLTGVPGVGKSTTISYFRNLVTYDEWVDSRLPLLAVPLRKLAKNKKQKDTVDTCIADQFAAKNYSLNNSPRL